MKFKKGTFSLSIAAFIVFVSLAFAPASGKRYLILAEYDPAAAVNHIVHLVRIPFTDGIPEPREKIMDIVTQQSGDKSPRIRFDLGPNQIYRNRYIITAYGQVVDIADKKVLVETHDRFIKASGDSIIFFTNDIFRGKFYSLLDLKTGTFKQISNPAYNPLFGRDVEADCSSRNIKIWFFPASAPKVEIVKDAGYGEDVALIPNGKVRLPMHWIDKDNFIFPYYNSTHDVVTITKVNVQSKEQKKIGIIDQLPENKHYSEFVFDPAGNILYHCARGYFQIDLKKNSLIEVKDYNIGFGFTIAFDETPAKGNQIKLNGSSIGYYFCNPLNACASQNSIAFPYEIVMEQERYLQGAMYWTSESSKWKSAGDSDLSAVIGWTND